MKFVFVILIACVLTANARRKGRKSTFTPSNDVLMNLYTRKNPTDPDILKIGDSVALLASRYQVDKPVKFLVHGWNGKIQSPELKDAFLKAADVNVIMVDWTTGAMAPEPTAIINAPIMGKWLATFIDWLTEFGSVYKGLHLIGISLGSHVVGFAGRSCLNGPVEYITACDPLKKFWSNSTEKISPADAKYVEVIHSNTDFAGLTMPTGHADFYPNGGANQPGCTDHLCSHLRAFDYFVDSIDNQNFKAIGCENHMQAQTGQCANLTQSYLGGMKPKNKTGVFFLETNPEKPFYKNYM